MMAPMLFSTKISDYGWLLVIFGCSTLFVPFSCQYVFEAFKKIEYPSLISFVGSVIAYVLAILFVKNPDGIYAAGIINTASMVMIVFMS